jgi:hypothetical protein
MHVVVTEMHVVGKEDSFEHTSKFMLLFRCLPFCCNPANHCIKTPRSS